MLKKKMFIALIDVFCIFMLFMSNLPPFKLLIQTAVSESDETESMDQVISDTGLLTIDIHTIDGNNPTYKEADPPDGCLGSSIKDNAYVKGYCEITNMDSGGSFASRMKLKVRGNTSARAAGPDGGLAGLDADSGPSVACLGHLHLVVARIVDTVHPGAESDIDLHVPER